LGRIKKLSLGPESSKKKKNADAAAVTQEEVKPGVDDTLLAFPDDHALTTDFAHFTVLQLKKCYLNKAGGSRCNCPLGYPGLGNNFSHISSHLVTCSKCPIEVKEKIKEFKASKSLFPKLLKFPKRTSYAMEVMTKKNKLKSLTLLTLHVNFFN